jgi:GT2 family glycosyltransferase
MSEAHPSVSAIIINYNTPELTARLIASFRKHTAGVAYNIVVVDNGSAPTRRYQIDKDEPALRLRQNESNLGFAKAVNLASMECQSPYLLFANSDCELDENIVPAMVAYMQMNPLCAACAPRLVGLDGTVHSSIRRFPDHKNIVRSRGSILGPGSDYTLVADRSRKNVEAMAATFMMVRRQDFEQVGRFDERFFMYVEDTDLCKRFHNLGKQVAYLGDLSAIHSWGASTRQHPWRMKFEHHRSIRRYFYKHYQDRKLANFLLTLQLTANYLLVSVKMLLNPGLR